MEGQRRQALRPPNPGYPAGVQGRRRVFHGTIVLVALAVAAYAVLLPQNTPQLVLGDSPEAAWSASVDVVTFPDSSSGAAATNRELEAIPSQRQSAGAATPAATPTRTALSDAVREEIGDPVRLLALGLPPLIERNLRPLCEPSSYHSYCIYTVREGDTLSHIAELFGLNGGVVPGWELLVASNKPDLTSSDDYIQPGQKLRIPVRRGVVHTVVLGESVGELAEAFDVTSAEIIAANRLSDGNLIRIGDVLLIPEPRQIPRPSLDTLEEAQPAPQPEPGAPAPEPALRPQPEAAPAPRETINRHPVSGFVWPLRTQIRITSYFGPSHPLGIDLGLRHDPTASVHAVEAGTVSFAGGDACCSYGLYVIVDHGNGFKTLYAHLRSIQVQAGQRVEQGQVLGIAGSTGYSTGVHLHFEVHLNGRRVNPLNYLP